ncbi:MAG: hypothetical protein R8J94_00975 [Acidimicrobiia bacterium]|nr:hypothetical protein [Acidimicrobiia bacterium]
MIWPSIWPKSSEELSQLFRTASIVASAYSAVTCNPIASTYSIASQFATVVRLDGDCQAFRVSGDGDVGKYTAVGAGPIRDDGVETALTRLQNGDAIAESEGVVHRLVGWKEDRGRFNGAGGVVNFDHHTFEQFICAEGVRPHPKAITQKPSSAPVRHKPTMRFAREAAAAGLLLRII